MAERRGVTLRKNEAGKGYYDIWFHGQHHRLYTGIALTPQNQSWFQAREILLLEMIEKGDFDVERARVVIGLAPQRRRATAVRQDITFKGFGEEWLEHKAGYIGEVKLSDYKITVKILSTTEITLNKKKIALGDIPMRDFQARHVDLVVNELKKRGGRSGKISARRLNDILFLVLRPMLDMAHGREYLARNPHNWVKRQPDNDTTDIKPFSFEQVKKILAVLPPFWQRYYIVAFGTGMRTSEQNGLKWKSVDFGEQIIKIVQGYSRGHALQLKTKESRREIQMLPPVEKALREHFTEVSHAPEHYVFPTEKGTPLWAQNVQLRIWAPALKAAGLEYRNPYQTRHTFASQMLKNGEDPAWVARMMGHANTRMLYQYYNNFIPHRTRQDGDRFTRAFQSILDDKPSLDHP